MIHLWVAIGAGIGGIARYWCNEVATDLFGTAFPWGILIINAIGSFIIGFFFTLTAPGGRLLVGTPARQFVMVGFCGGYTTFSSFSLDTLNLLRDGRALVATSNALLSVTMCLLFVWLGHTIAVQLNRPKEE